MKVGFITFNPKPVRGGGLIRHGAAVRATNPGGGRLTYTMGIIRSLIERGKRDGKLRALVAGLVRDSEFRENDFAGQFEALGNWLRARVRYVRDPWAVESVSDALDVLKRGYGDCDDLTVLAGAVLESVGFQTRIKVVGREYPSHVFLVAKVGGEWIPLDLARPFEKIFEKKNMCSSCSSGG